MNPITNIKTIVKEFNECSDTNTDTLLKIFQKFHKQLASGEKVKRDGYLALSDKGLKRLFALFKSENELIRKNSFKVVALLLSGDEVLQNIFCEKFSFNPVGNVIVLNWMPQEMKSKLKLNEHILYEIKKTQNEYIKGDERLYWQWPSNDKYNNDNIPDPQKYLLGIYTIDRAVIPMEEKKFDDEFDVNDLVQQLEQ
jgi:hypothetical protein